MSAEQAVHTQPVAGRRDRAALRAQRFSSVPHAAAPGPEFQGLRRPGTACRGAPVLGDGAASALIACNASLIAPRRATISSGVASARLVEHYTRLATATTRRRRRLRGVCGSSRDRFALQTLVEVIVLHLLTGLAPLNAANCWFWGCESAAAPTPC